MSTMNVINLYILTLHGCKGEIHNYGLRIFRRHTYLCVRACSDVKYERKRECACPMKVMHYTN